MNDSPVTDGAQVVRPGASDHTMVFHQPGGQTIKEHAHPAWNVVVPLTGRIDWYAGSGPGRRTAGAVFPPHVAYRTSSAARHASVLIDPWALGMGPGPGRPIALDEDTARQVHAHWSPDQAGDPDEAARETVALLRRRDVLPAPISIDPRVAAALRSLASADSIPDIAVVVGLSPSRLRALIHAQTGTSLMHLRMWQRLRAAIRSLPTTPIAVAAIDAGFADQAHLTRTATRLLGQTPGDLARLLGSVQSQYCDGGKPAALAPAA